MRPARAAPGLPVAGRLSTYQEDQPLDVLAPLNARPQSPQNARPVRARPSSPYRPVDPDRSGSAPIQMCRTSAPVRAAAPGARPWGGPGWARAGRTGHGVWWADTKHSEVRGLVGTSGRLTPEPCVPRCGGARSGRARRGDFEWRRGRLVGRPRGRGIVHRRLPSAHNLRASPRRQEKTGRWRLNNAPPPGRFSCAPLPVRRAGAQPSAFSSSGTAWKRSATRP